MLLRTAYVEHLNSGDLWHRVYPGPIVSHPEEEGKEATTSPVHREDQLLHDWFRAMCRENPFFCQ